MEIKPPVFCVKNQKTEKKRLARNSLGISCRHSGERKMTCYRSHIIAFHFQRLPRTFKMTSSLFSSNGLTGSLFADAEMLGIVSDYRWLEAMLDFEAALARAEANAGVIPESAAKAIISCCDVETFDIAEIGRRTTLAGNPAIPLVTILTEKVRKIDPAAAEFVHYGATSQDVIDSAMGYLIGDARSIILKRISGCCHAVAALTNKHRSTPMVGRTLLQHALPISFGLKCANWLDALLKNFDEMALKSPQWLQFGGAAGTLAALGDKAIAVQAELLKGGVMPKRAGRSWQSFTGRDVPWHGMRSQQQLIACQLGVATAAFGKIARDVTLLMQTEVAEVFEPTAPGKGGSSTLPHKRNPVQSVAIISAAMRTPSLVATMLTSGLQEHERAAGGWHTEWDVMRELLVLTGTAASHLETMLNGLEVDTARMRKNLDLTQGLIMAERVTFALAPTLGKAKAKSLMETACKEAVKDGVHLHDIMKNKSEAKGLDLDALFDPATYLGASNNFIDTILKNYEEEKHYMGETY
jgi:3-carboxy-cis,cis-muconate cycloisomerase